MKEGGRRRGIQCEEMDFGNSGGSVRRRGGRGDVGGWSWMGGVKGPLFLVLQGCLRGRGRG